MYITLHPQPGNKWFLGFSAPIPDLVERGLLDSKHTHTSFTASNMLEAKMISIVKGFTVPRSAGNIVKLDRDTPGTEEETKAEDPS